MSRQKGGRRLLLPGYLAVGLIILSICSHAVPQDDADIDPNAKDMVDFILDAVASERSVSPERLVSKLVDMGPRAVPCLVASHSRFTDSAQVEVVLAALRRLDPESVNRYFLQQTEGGGKEPARAVAYRKLGEHGTAAAIPAVIGQMPENYYSLKKSAELCLTKLLRKYDSRETYLLVGEAMKGLEDDTASRVACCMGDTGSPHAMGLILTLFGRTGPLDHALVSAIAQMPDALPAQDVVPRLRDLLESEVHGVAREAITALGMMQDTESAKLLVDMLGDAQEGIRGNTHWALKNISGLEFPDDPVRWRLWYDGEVTWWESTGKQLLEALYGGDREAILAALRGLSRGRLFRDRIRPALEPLLDDADSEIRAAAEELMQQLGFAKPKDVRDIGSAMASRGFKSIPKDQIPRSAPAEKEEPRTARSTSFVPIAGLVVLLVLAGRIFGPTAWGAVRNMWSGEDKQDGPMTVKLKPKKYANKPPRRAGSQGAGRKS